MGHKFQAYRNVELSEIKEENQVREMSGISGRSHSENKRDSNQDSVISNNKQLHFVQSSEGGQVTWGSLQDTCTPTPTPIDPAADSADTPPKPGAPQKSNTQDVPPATDLDTSPNNHGNNSKILGVSRTRGRRGSRTRTRLSHGHDHINRSRDDEATEDSRDTGSRDLPSESI